MSSKVSICNYALSRLGADRITSLSDNTAEARLCNALLEDAIKEVLVAGDWRFASKRASLNATTNTPTFEYSYEFQLPTNPVCLIVREINEENAGDYEYSIEGDKLLADISTMKIRYTAYITDSGSFSPMFEECLKLKLCALMCLNLTGNSALIQTFEALYENKLGHALSYDGQQGSKEFVSSSDLHDVR